MKQTAWIMCMIMAIMVSQTAQAQTAIAPETANLYYTQCMSHDDQRFSDEAQEALCSCTSAKMMSAITYEDIAHMTVEPGPGRQAYEKMMTYAYAPCMQVPIYDELYKECMSDGKIEKFALRDTGALCRCMAKRTTDPMDVYVPELIDFVFRKFPDTKEDPYDILINNQQVRSRAYDNIYNCLREGN